MHRGCARCYYDTVELVLLNIAHDEILAWIRTHIGVVSGDGNLRMVFGNVLDCLHIHMVRNIDPAMTDVNTDLHPNL